MEKHKNINQTRLLHDAYKPDVQTGATTAPLVLSTAFAAESAEQLANIFAGEEPGYIYARLNNPSVLQFEKKMAMLEDGVGAIACASGMAAISCAVLAFVRSGETILSSSSLFAGTYSLFRRTMSRFGISVRFFDPTKPDELEEVIDASSRVVFTETIGNPKMDVAPIDELADVAHKHGLPLIVDNTVTTPYLLRAKDFGADMVVQSSSKFIDGQGRGIGGCLVDLGTGQWDISKYDYLADYKRSAKQKALLTFIRAELFNNLGGCLSPYNAALHVSGLETLGLRVKQHFQNAETLARFLAKHPQVIKVSYPGLEEDPGFSTASRLLRGGYGGLLTFDVGSEKRAFEVLNKVTLGQRLANIGDAKTLVIHPASTIYSSFPPDLQMVMGVTDGLIRVSVGLEEADDLLADFEQALKKL